MRGKKIEELNPHYKGATKSLLWAYRRLGDAEKYFKTERDRLERNFESWQISLMHA